MTSEPLDTPAHTPETSVVESVGGLDELRGPWSDLAAASGNVFATWEWAATWWRLHGRDGRLLLHTCREADGRVAALLPIYLWKRRPFRVARFLGHGPADQLGPVCAPSDRPRAAEALRCFVGQAQLDLLLAELLPVREG